MCKTFLLTQITCCCIFVSFCLFLTEYPLYKQKDKIRISMAVCIKEWLSFQKLEVFAKTSHTMVHKIYFDICLVQNYININTCNKKIVSYRAFSTTRESCQLTIFSAVSSGCSPNTFSGKSRAGILSIKKGRWKQKSNQDIKIMFNNALSVRCKEQTSPGNAYPSRYHLERGGSLSLRGLESSSHKKKRNKWQKYWHIFIFILNNFLEYKFDAGIPFSIWTKMILHCFNQCFQWEYFKKEDFSQGRTKQLL